MGAFLVTEAPTESERQSNVEFLESQFPYYLSIGMTYEQYWNGEPSLVKYYRQAEELRLKKQNQMLWLQGMYIYDALCDVAPVLHAFAASGTKPQPYPGYPYAITKQEMEEKEAREKEEARKKALQSFEIWAAKFNVSLESRGQ